MHSATVCVQLMSYYRIDENYSQCSFRGWNSARWAKCSVWFLFNMLGYLTDPWLCRNSRGAHRARILCYGKWSKFWWQWSRSGLSAAWMPSSAGSKEQYRFVSRFADKWVFRTKTLVWQLLYLICWIWGIAIIIFCTQMIINCIIHACR